MHVAKDFHGVHAAYPPPRKDTSPEECCNYAIPTYFTPAEISILPLKSSPQSRSKRGKVGSAIDKGLLNPQREQKNFDVIRTKVQL